MLWTASQFRWWCVLWRKQDGEVGIDKVTLDKAVSLPPRSALCRVGDHREANGHIYGDSGSDKRPEDDTQLLHGERVSWRVQRVGTNTTGFRRWHLRGDWDEVRRALRGSAGEWSRQGGGQCTDPRAGTGFVWLRNSIGARRARGRRRE